MFGASVRTSNLAVHSRDPSTVRTDDTGCARHERRLCCCLYCCVNDPLPPVLPLTSAVGLTAVIAARRTPQERTARRMSRSMTHIYFWGIFVREVAFRRLRRGMQLWFDQEKRASVILLKQPIFGDGRNRYKHFNDFAFARNYCSTARTGNTADFGFVAACALEELLS